MFLIPVSRSGVLLLSAQRFRKVRLRDADWLAMTASTFVGPEHQASRSTMNDPSDGLGDRAARPPISGGGSAATGTNSHGTTRVLIASAVRLYADGLSVALRNDGRLNVVGTASHVSAAFALAREQRPDVILLDAGMPDALAAARIIRRELAPLAVVAFAVSDGAKDAIACVEAGVAEYVARDATVDDLVTAVDRVRRGEAQCNPSVTGAMFRRLAELADIRPNPHRAATLTGRESEILALIDRGFTNKEIASRLRVSVATVKNHVHNLLEKLQVRRRAEAAAQVRHGARRNTPRGTPRDLDLA